MESKGNNKRMKLCSRFEECSAPICLLDELAEIRTSQDDDVKCPFTIRKKSYSEKGIVTLMPERLLKVIPKSNLPILNKRSLKRRKQIK
jgi:hypothetical protein